MKTRLAFWMAMLVASLFVANNTSLAQEQQEGFWGDVKFANGSGVPLGTPVTAKKGGNPNCHTVQTGENTQQPHYFYWMSATTLRNACGNGTYNLVVTFQYNGEWYYGNRSGVLTETGGERVDITVYPMDSPEFQGP